MKRMALCLAFMMLLSTLSACLEKEEVPPVSSQPEEVNSLISDLPFRGVEWTRRRYDLYYIVAPLADSGRRKADKDASLEELYRFVYRYSIGNLASAFFVFDLRSNHIYSSTRGIIDDVLYAEQIVEITDEDVLLLKKAIGEAGVQDWWESYPVFWGSGWDVAIEYNDGSIEQHRGPGRPKGMEVLEAFVAAQAGGYPARMREERKTATHIDYLLTTYERPPEPEGVPLDILNLTDAAIVERILVFQAEGPHTVLDHSRQPQKTLLLDVLNDTMYFEPERTVYENITLAESVSPLDHDLLGRIAERLHAPDVQLWTPEFDYIGNTDNKTMSGGDIPAWCIGIQLTDGRVLHYRGDGMGENGFAPGCKEMLDAIWAEMV